MEINPDAKEKQMLGRTVYLQQTTGKLHTRESCSITRRTRYFHFPVEFTPERRERCERCDKCWDGFKPAKAVA